MHNTSQNQMADLQQLYNTTVQKVTEYESIIAQLQDAQNQALQDANVLRAERDRATNEFHICAQQAELTVHKLRTESVENAARANETISNLENNLKVTTMNVEALGNHLNDVKIRYEQREKGVRAHFTKQNEEPYQYYVKAANEGVDKIKSADKQNQPNTQVVRREKSIKTLV